MTQGNRRSARLAKTGAPLQGQHTTRLSTAQGCVATDTHCVSLDGAALQGTPSSQPSPVTAPNNPMPAQHKEAKDEDTDKDYLGHHLHQDRDSLPAGPDQGCDGKEAKDEDSDNDYTIDTIDTDNDYTIDTDNDDTIDDTALQPPPPTTTTSPTTGTTTSTPSTATTPSTTTSTSTCTSRGTRTSTVILY